MRSLDLKNNNNSLDRLGRFQFTEERIHVPEHRAMEIIQNKARGKPDIKEMIQASGTRATAPSISTSVGWVF